MTVKRSIVAGNDCGWSCSVVDRRRLFITAVALLVQIIACNRSASIFALLGRFCNDFVMILKLILKTRLGLGKLPVWDFEILSFRIIPHTLI